MILDEIKNIKSTPKELKDFGLSVGVVLMAIGGFLLWRHSDLWPYFMGAGAVLVLLGYTVPKVLVPLQKPWMAFAVVMGWFMTRVILSIMFFLVVTPMSLTMRLFGSKFLVLRPDPEAKTYWQKREPEEHDPDRHSKQF